MIIGIITYFWPHVFKYIFKKEGKNTKNIKKILSTQFG